MALNPQIEYKHVLGELSVNRNDPCEVLRELISNSYDASAQNILYIPIQDRQGIAFLDDGTGLHENKVDGISPWEAFFSIGKSTKRKGDSIGYKCQGSKLCFACSRILVASISESDIKWRFKIVENPRTNLDVTYDITPDTVEDIEPVIDRFFPTPSAATRLALGKVKDAVSVGKFARSATLILIDGLETEGFTKYFATGAKISDSYVYNYIRFYTCHGDVRYLTTSQGFSANHRNQISVGIKAANLKVLANGKLEDIPFGYPYLERGAPDPNLKSPAQISRLRDGRFFTRAAKRFQVGASKYSMIVAIDGNRRAHDEYKNLGRKGQAKSGIRLSDQRGLFISVKGIKICKYADLLSNLDGYEVLSEGDASSHYTIVIEGDFDLVTNRSALSKKAYDALTDSAFLTEVKKFLDNLKNSDATFKELLARLRKESSELLLNEQIESLEKAKKEIKERERLRVQDATGQEHIFLSPNPGEEYLVGVLYSQLSTLSGKASEVEKFWRRILTFSTQGIDSLGLREENSSSPLAEKNICSIEYKYELSNSGPFNHALAVVDFIVAWEVNLNPEKTIVDTYTCFGKVRKIEGNDFEWEIYDIENSDGGTYKQTVTVIALRQLILSSFETKISPRSASPK